MPLTHTAAAAGLLLDVTRLLERTLQGRLPTGVDRVGLAYVGHFGARARALLRFGGRWVVPDAADSARLFGELLRPTAHSGRVMRALVARHYVALWRRPARGDWLFNVTHSGLERAGYRARVQRHGLRPVYFLHDLIPVTYPEYGRPGEADRHRRRVQTMLQTARGIVVNSAVTGAELDACARALGAVAPPWVAAHLAPPPGFACGHGAPPLPQPYFVLLGTIEPRKNHLLVLQIWRQLAQALGPAAPRLVVIGQRGWECEQVVDMLERCASLRGLVHEVPRCDDTALALWLRHARALLFPSFAEGYGIPLVEALSVGTPVIASALPVFRELAGDIPDYLDPLDGPGWQRAILGYAQTDGAGAAGPSARAAQLARMQAWQAPTWARHFEQVEAFMARLAGEA